MKHKFLKFISAFLLLMSSLTAWSATTNETVYFSPEWCDKNWTSPKIQWSPGDNWYPDDAMISTGETFLGYPVYKYTIENRYGGYNLLQFHQGEDYVIFKTGWYACNVGGKIYNGSSWYNYSKDESYTFYFATDWSSAYANCNLGYNVWKDLEMTNTGKTYNGKKIYSITVAAQGFNKIEFHKASGNWENKVVGYDNNDTYKKDFTNALCTAEYTWVTYNYDVTLTFDPKNGGASTTESVLKGGDITAPAAPSKTGYTFVGWKNGSTTVQADGTISNVQADATYEAQWSPITYTIAYAGNDNTGGSTANSSHTYDVAKYLTANGFTREYVVTYEYDGATGGNSTASATATYTFKNWTCSANENTYSDGASVTNLTSTNGATVTMTAQWNSGSVTLPTPTKTGYTFSGWYNSDSKIGDGGASYTPTADITLTAHWTAKQTNITLNKNGGDTDGTPTQITATYGQQLPALQDFVAPKKDGFNFKGYYSATTDGTQYYNNAGARSYDGTWASEDVTATFYAQWENAATYSLTVATSPTTAFTASSGNAENITLGTPYDISATLAAKGYTFTGWTAEPEANASFADKNAQSTTVTVQNGSVTVTANAVAYTTTLKLWNNDGTQNYREQLATYGQTISVSSIERTGYKYGGYVTQSDGGGAQFILIAGGFSSNVANWIEDYKWSRNVNGETKELYAKWTALYWTKDISKNYTASGVDGGKYKATYDAMSIEITTPLAPRAGYTLKGYAISNGGAKVANVDGTLIANVDGWTDPEGKWINTNPGTIYAIWEENLTTVTLSANPEGAGTIRIGGSTATEAVVGITTTKAASAYSIDNNAYTFTSWTATNCSVENPTSSTGGQLSGDGTNATGTLVANFALIPCNLVQLDGEKNGKTKNTFPMQYDVTKKAYYVDVTSPDASPFYYYFDYNNSAKIISTDWNAKEGEGSYARGQETALQSQTKGSFTKTDTKDISSWSDKPSTYCNGSTSYPIRVWLDLVNSKVWVTADFTNQWSLAGTNYDSEWNVIGTELSNWSTSANVFGEPDANNITLKLNLSANTNYQFKIVDRSANTYYGYEDNTITADVTTAILFETSKGNCKLKSNVAGEYTFVWNTNTKKLKVTYPTSYAVNFGKGTGGATVTAKIDNTTDITTGELVISGSSVTFEQTAATGYTFKEWNTKQDGTGNPLSTDASYTTTINAITNVYAIYTEDKWSTNVSYGAHGSVSPTGTMDILQVTGQQLTATADAGYYFTGWTVTGSITPANSTNATETFFATAAGGTITANFAERWVLRGSTKASDSELGGMPGWNNETAMSVDANGVASVNLTLTPNTDFKFKIRDLKTNSDKGQENTATLPPMTEPSSKWTLNGSNDVYLATVGHGQYTIYVEVDGDNPQVYYSAPTSHKINMDTKTTSEGCASASPGTGGTLTAKDGDNFTISDGKYVINNGSVTFTATAYNGYSFEGFYSDASCENQLQAATAGTTYTITNITEGKSVYAKFSERLYNVTYNNGETTTTIQAGVASHPEITAVQKDGRKFMGWETYGVSVANSTAKTTTISYVDMGVYDHRVTATYGDLDRIYFDVSNCSEWNPTCMYVYFYWDEYWTDAKGTGTDTGGKYTGTRLQMQQVNLGNNKFWVAYYDGAEIGGDGGISTIQRVAFADKEQNGGDFYECTISYMVFNSCMNMCVLSNNNKKSPTDIPSACYRNEGFWKNYDANNSGLYLKIEGKSDVMIDQKISADTYSKSIHLDPESTGSTYLYYFYIGGCNGQVYSNDNATISKDNPSATLVRHEQDPSISKNKVTLSATTPGSYVFTVKHTMDDKLEVSVEYPVSEGDYRVISVINDDAHDNGYIYKHSSTAKDDLASFFVKTGMTVNLQKCTHIDNTNITWENVAGQSISNFTANGYHNFKIHQDDSGNATLTDAGEYEGNFYLRTDVAPGGWSNYLTNAGNIMQENEYGMNDAQSFKFTHAYTNHVGHGGNVKFVIANDYSKCISDTLVKDDFITEDSGNLPSGKDANVRFMWNKNNNTVARAYIGGSALTTDRYLILLGNKDNSNKSLMVDANGVAFPEGGTGRAGLKADEAIFTDLGNWIYQVNIKAFSGAAVKLMADFAGETQYFVGAAGDEPGSWRTIMAGSETENPYTMQVVYDFKSNRLVAGFVPDGQEITSDIVLNGDLLLLREMQEDAKEIKFGAATYSISAIDHIYCGLQINKGHAGQNDGMIGSTNSDYAKTMYWISFPFDVKINEIFGVDGYGKKWIMQRYNGEKRAANGWFKGDGVETFWEYLAPTATLKAYKGYLLILNADYFNETNDEVWQIESVDHVTFYFPSANGNIGIINKSEYTQEVPDHKCGIDREFEVEDSDGNKKTVNHKNTDSYWNVIGVPAFQNKTMALGSETDTDLKAVYEWNSTNNTYNVQALSTDFEFKTMYAYMVQFGGIINWTDVSVVANKAPYAYADDKNYMIELFFNGNGAEDHTYINLSDEAATDFELNEDMMKIDNAGFPNIYSFAGNYNVAYNETKMENQTVMLGVSAPKDGSYTFSMPKDFSGKAVLVDLEDGTTTDLNVSNYSVDLNKGTYNNRFQLMLEVEAKIPTNIENANGEWNADGKTKKLLINDQIYLINAGRIYNATGTMVK